MGKRRDHIITDIRGGIDISKLPRKLQEAILQYGYTPIKLKPRAKYEIGKVYWSGYWEKWYQVLNVEYMGNSIKRVVVRWQDGKVSEHMTSLNPARDYELKY